MKLSRFFRAAARVLLGLAIVAAPRAIAQATAPVLAPAPGTTPPATTDPATATTASPAPVPTTSPSSPETFDFRIGAFVVANVNVNMNVHSNRGGGIGTDLDFIDVLGGDRQINVFRADAHWNIHGPHGLDASWYDIKLTGRRDLAFDIDFQGEHYTGGTTVSSVFRTVFYKVSYGYTFQRGKRHEFAVLAGFDVVVFDVSISATQFSKSATFKATAPLPAFGFGWHAQWTPKLQTRVTAQYFGISLEGDKYSGQLIDALAAVEYQIFRNVGLGVGYNRFDLNGDFKADRIDFKLSAKYAYDGMLAYLVFRW